AGIRTALPLRETISTASRSSFTRSMRGNRVLRASLALMDMMRASLSGQVVQVYGTTHRRRVTSRAAIGDACARRPAEGRAIYEGRAQVDAYRQETLWDIEHQEATIRDEHAAHLYDAVNQWGCG